MNGVLDAHAVDCESQFWKALENIVTSNCPTHEQIDDALRAWLYLSAACRDIYLHTEDDVAECSSRLLSSSIFCENAEYVRKQIVYSLLYEDEAGPLHVIANFLLSDGRNHEGTFPQMIEEGCFLKLLELIGSRRQTDPRLHRLLLELMYEMSRVERLRPTDLMQIDDSFVAYLFELIEGVSDDVDDPYHYPVIRVLLVLNEQYMVASTSVDPASSSSPLTNRVIKMLCARGPQYRTFGENIILLLNRETETSLQLLILKLLYLLFTTKATYEYFYTNDLRVLLDVIIRNLLDLPDERMSLRHTYLRVLAPLLSHTQLSQPPHYKKDEILKLIRILNGSGNAHFAPADDTTLRLVERVSAVSWLTSEAQPEPCEEAQSPTSTSSNDEGQRTDSPVLQSLNQRVLGISLSESQTASKASIVDVVAVTEKPGVKTPSRANGASGNEKITSVPIAVPPPPPPSRSPNPRSQSSETLPRAKQPPEVPKHRHGVPLAPRATLVMNGNGNGNGNPVKKPPPKVPPPRRKRILPIQPTPDQAEA